MVRWRLGDGVVIRWGRPGDVGGTPARVVEDNERHVVLFTPDGSVGWSRRAARDGRAERERLIAAGQPREPHVACRWTNNVLRIFPAGRPYSVWVFWSPEWELQSYYVNLESPARRTPVGIDIQDRVLDIVVGTDRAWQLKDAEELQAWVEGGSVSARAAAVVHRDAEHARAEIEAWSSPYCDGWERWRPPADWGAPGRLSGWDEPAFVAPPFKRA